MPTTSVGMAPDTLQNVTDNVKPFYFSSISFLTTGSIASAQIP